MVRIAFSILFLSCCYFSIAQSWSETNKITASDRNQNNQFAKQVDIDGEYAICGAEAKGSNEGGPGNQAYAGAAYIYEHIGSEWVEVGQLTHPSPFEYDWFGGAVAISGNVAVVTAHRDDEDENEGEYLMNAGSAFIYERTEDGSWVQVQKIVASDRTENAWYGISAAVEGNTIIIGAQYERYDQNGENLVYGSGAAYIYERNENGLWEEEQKIAANVRASDDLFGCAVGIWDNQIVVGAYREDQNENESSNVTDSGAAYVFEKNESDVWVQVAKLVGFDREPYDNFGSEVAIENGTVVIGAWGEDDDETGVNNLTFAGSAYIFENTNPGEWSFAQKIVASDREEDANFGLGVDISENIILVGARYETEDESGENELNKAGAAYYFEKNPEGVWVESQKIVNSDRAAFDYFGEDVGISGQYSIIGAYTEDEDQNQINTMNSAGSAYVFSSFSCEPSASLDVLTVCDSLTWINGVTYTESISDVDFFTFDELGCDSIVSLDLTVNYSSTSYSDLIKCDSLLWLNGETYYESISNVSYLTQNEAGCDSLIFLDLTIIDLDNVVLGCTYNQASNFNPGATLDDGSCVYETLCPFDSNGDGLISTIDLSSFLSVYGDQCD